MGTQVVSSRKTAPKYGFGTASRKGQHKIFMGGAFQYTANYGVTSPGPSAYSHHNAIGRQVRTGRQTDAAWVFGTEHRAGRGISDHRKGRPSTPGPGSHCTDVGSVGRQSSSKRPSSAQYGFGTASRAAANKVFISQQHMAGSAFGAEVFRSPGPASAANKRPASAGYSYGFGSEPRFQRVGAASNSTAGGAPGPGSYATQKTDHTFGKQPVSIRETNPLFGFGTATRDDMAQVFVSHDMAKNQQGGRTISPGPGEYKVPQGVGKQKTTRGRPAPAWGFGTSTRTPLRRSDVPGPGAYNPA